MVGAGAELQETDRAPVVDLPAASRSGASTQGSVPISAERAQALAHLRSGRVGRLTGSLAWLRLGEYHPQYSLRVMPPILLLCYSVDNEDSDSSRAGTSVRDTRR